MLKIIGNIWGFLTGILNAVSSVFGFLKQRDAESNSPAMIQNKEDLNVQSEKDKVNTDLQKNDINELGKDIAE